MTLKLRNRRFRNKPNSHTFSNFNFEKLDLKKNEIFRILKISKMGSALKTESKTVFGDTSASLTRSVSYHVLVNDHEYAI